MRKFTLILSLLVAFVTTAMADLTQNYKMNTNFWENTDSYPTELDAVIDGAKVRGDGVAIKKDGATVQVSTNAVTVDADGNVVVTFTHDGGNHMLNILGVDLVDADGNVVAEDYHYGSAGSNLYLNVYTLEGVTAGAALTLRSFVYDNTATGDRTNSAQGGYVITNVTGEERVVLKPKANLESALYTIREVNGNLAYYNGESLVRGITAANASDENNTFFICKGNDGNYTIQTADGKYVTYSATGNGTALSVSEAAGATDDNKWWTIREGNNSGVKIIVPATNDIYNAPGWNFAITIDGVANAGVGLWNSTGNNSQWYISKATPIQEGYGKLSIANVAAYSDGTNIVKDNTSGKNVFKFTKGENGYYTIQDVDGKYLIYTQTSNHLLTLIDEAGANDDNKWWIIAYDLQNRENCYDIFPKQNGASNSTPAFNWSQADNTKLGFWQANDGNSYCSLHIFATAKAGSFVAFQSTSTHQYCADKFVKTVPVITNYTGGGYAANRDHTQLVFDECDPTVTPSAVFEIVAGENSYEFKLKNVHTQEYVRSFVKGDRHMGTEAEATAITFKYLGTNQYAVYGTNNGNPMHAQQAYNVIVTWSGEAGSASAWEMVEVETPTHTLTVGETEWSTLVLGFNATIPTTEGFKAYSISDIDGKEVVLNEVTGILGANVPVLVNAPAGDYKFTYTTEAATVTESNLNGTLYTTNVAVEGDAYILATVNNTTALYKVKKNDDGTLTNNANKAYFVLTSGDAAKSFNIRFGEGTTGVEEVVVENGVKTIFDLTGRRVESVTVPGIYIVNGKKVLVK